MVNTTYMCACLEKEELIRRNAVSFFSDKPLNAIEVPNGLFLSWKNPEKNGPLHGVGGVLDENGDYVDASASIAYGDTSDRFNGTYPVDEKKVTYCDETVIYLGLFHKQWGHFLVDFVPRLWYFVDANVPNKIVYTSNGSEIGGSYLRLLQLAGIDDSKLLRIDKPTRFRKIIIPELSYISGGYYTKEFQGIYQTVQKNIGQLSDKPLDNVYLSRRHIKWYKSKDIGEKGIEKAFNDNGYISLFMEELTLDQQIFYVSHAKGVAAMSGTLCHNILFGSKETELIIINKTKRINGHQILINQMLGNLVTYVDVYKEPYKKFPISYGSGPFWVTSRSQELKRFMKDKGYSFKEDSLITLCIDFMKYSFLCATTRVKKNLINIETVKKLRKQLKK